MESDRGPGDGGDRRLVLGREITPGEVIKKEEPIEPESRIEFSTGGASRVIDPGAGIGIGMVLEELVEGVKAPNPHVGGDV